MAASGEQPRVPLKYQTWVLKVLIHCEGCKKKVRRILHSIDGVYTTEIDAKQQQVTVIGNIDGATLVKKLARSGKLAQVVPAKPQPKEKQSESKKEKKKDEGKNKEGKNKNKEKNKETGKPVKDLLLREEQVEEKEGKTDGNTKQTEKKDTTNVDTPPVAPPEKTKRANDKPKSKAKKAEAMGEGGAGGGRDIQPAVEVNHLVSFPPEGYVSMPACMASSNPAWQCTSSGHRAVPPPAPCCVHAPHLKGGWYYYVPVEDENPSTACNVM